MTTKKDIEFGKFLQEIEYKGIKSPIDYSAMDRIIIAIENLNITNENFEENRGILKKLLCILGNHIFPIYLNEIDNESLKIRIPGSHDYNLCLNDHYFSYKLYNLFYKDFINQIKIIINSKGKIFPRYIYEIERTRNKKNEINFLKITNIYLERKDLPEDTEFDNCKVDKYYRFKGDGRLGSLEEYENIYKKVLSDTWEKSFNEFKEETYPVIKEIKTNNSKYENLENLGEN